MPKKFKGENSKAAEARARKDAVREAEHQKKKQAEEDAYWADDDKHVARKQQRKVNNQIGSDEWKSVYWWRHNYVIVVFS